MDANNDTPPAESLDPANQAQPPQQPLPRDTQRLSRPLKKSAAPLAAQQAKALWAKLHGHKFASNAGRLGRRGRNPSD